MGHGLNGIGTLLDFGGIGRVEERSRRHRQNLAARSVHQHGRTIGALDLLDALLKAVFKILLHVDVDGNHDVLSVDGGRIHLGTVGDGNAVALFIHAARLEHALARRARKDVVVIQLEAREAIAVHIHQTHDLACGLPIGVHTLGVFEEINASQRLLAQRIGLLHVGLALHVDEGGVLRKVIRVILGLSAKRFRKSVRSAVHVGDLFRVDVDRGSLHAGRKHVAVTVVDGSAPRGNVDAQRARGGGGIAVFGGLDDLQIHKAARPYQGEPQEDDQKPR